MEFYEPKNYAQIDLGALRKNFEFLKNRIKEKSPKTEPICVLKADAYGHGAAKCAKALISAGVEFFAVSDISEALELRCVDSSIKILILGYTKPQNVPLLIKKNIIQEIHDESYGKALVESIKKAKASGELSENARLSVHIKLNTGMNRLGFSAYEDKLSDSVFEILSLSREKELSLEGIFSHFMCADSLDDRESEGQKARFDKALLMLKENGLNLKAHLSNSAGSIRFGGTGYDYARLGIALYGLSPSPEMAGPIIKAGELLPVMQLFSSVSQVKELKKGTSVSYGATYTAEKDMKIAAVSIGYADGFIRDFSGGEVIINGKRAKVIGRVCMDQMLVDLDGIEAKEGDRVTIYDESGENIEALARRANTISYELVCLVGKRVPRIYINE